MTASRKLTPGTILLTSHGQKTVRESIYYPLWARYQVHVRYHMQGTGQGTGVPDLDGPERSAEAGILCTACRTSERPWHGHECASHGGAVPYAIAIDNKCFREYPDAKPTYGRFEELAHFHIQEDAWVKQLHPCLMIVNCNTTPRPTRKRRI